LQFNSNADFVDQSGHLLVVLYSVPLIFGSVQNWMDKLNGVLLPFYLIGLVALEW
jgi:hypothetical protein